MKELWQLGALESAEKIRSKEVSSREVLAAYLARIEALVGTITPIVPVAA